MWVPLATFGTLRAGTLRLGSLRFGYIALGALRLGTLRLGNLRLPLVRCGWYSWYVLFFIHAFGTDLFSFTSNHQN